MMREIHTIDPGRYEPTAKKGIVRLVGMLTAQEVFDKLEAHLKQVDLLPDEYFNAGRYSWGDKNPELPNYSRAICSTSWGSNEGIYIDIDLQYYDENRNKQLFHLATGKTLGESGDEFLHMSRIAAECSMMLNGWGAIARVSEESLEQSKSEVTTSEKAIEMLENMVNSKELSDRLAVARQGYGLDRLVHDEAWSVRNVCAAQGYGQNILVHDPETTVRETLAKNGYCLDVLVNDKAPFVRAEVAKQGYGLDQLVRDENEVVRAAVVMQNRPQDLVVLANDDSWYVRAMVATRGFGLDKLAKDSKQAVRVETENYLRNHGLSLSEWVSANADKCVLPKKKNSLDAVIQRANIQKEEQGSVAHENSVPKNDREGR